MDCPVHFIRGTGPVIDQFGREVIDTDYRDVQNSWQIIQKPGPGYRQLARKAWGEIDKIGLPERVKKGRVHSMIRRRVGVTDPVYFVLVDDNGNAPLYELLTLTNQYQVSKGNLPLHTGAVIRENRLYLFGGPSGAGKSTVSRFSAEKGYGVLDEDQILLKAHGSSDYRAQAWGYSLEKSEAQLWAIFKLVKATDDRVISLTPKQTTRFLLERYIEAAGNMAHPESLGRVFHQISVIAQCIPAYELHFRKPLSFWNVIDAEISNPASQNE